MTIVRMQIFCFFLFGMIAWNGVDDAIRTARSDGELRILLSMSLKSLTEFRV